MIEQGNAEVFVAFRSLLRLVLTLGVFAGPSLAFAQTVREKVAVEVITIRLTARDASGKRVEDLAPSDLTMTVDGKPVAIETFARPTRAASAPVSGDDAPAAPEPGLAPPAQGRPVQTVILLDDGGTHPFDRKDVCDELERFIRADVGRQEFLVARLVGPRVLVEAPWTSDPGVAAAAVHRVRDKPVLNAVPAASTLAGSTGPVGPSSATWIQLHTDRLHGALLEALSAFPDGQAERQLLVVSGGVALMRPQDLAAVLRCQMTVGERTRLSAAATDISAAHAREIERATFALWTRAVYPAGDALTMSDVVAKALERDVAIIPVLADAMDRGDFDLAGGGGAGVLSPHIAVGQAMTEIAESTGAEPILVPKKTAARLTEIGDRAVYTLTFRDPVGDHHYHPLEIACLRPGVKIEYRRGYRIPAEDERTLDTVVARFLQPGNRPDPMAVSIVQAPSGGKGSRARTTLQIRYAPPLETGAGPQREIQIIAVGEDRDGNRTAPILWSGTAERTEGTDRFAAAMELGVAPGGYKWSVGLRDQPTGLTSYVVVPAAGKP